MVRNLVVHLIDPIDNSYPFIQLSLLSLSFQNLKEYKRKLDSRLGQCILLCLITLATLLCLYGFIHGAVHDTLYTYVNRTHQIVHELETAVDENFGGVRGKYAFAILSLSYSNDATRERRKATMLHSLLIHHWRS